MVATSKRNPLNLVPVVFTDAVGQLLGRLVNRRLRRQLVGEATEAFLVLLLRAMALMFYLSKGYRKNIVGFKGCFVLRTFDGSVSASVVFEDREMKVFAEERDDWDTRITFADASALRGFIFSPDRDILNAILVGKLESEGNNNHMYRFGFLAQDLARRLGVLEAITR